MSKFGKMAVVVDQSVKMPIIYPGEIDPITDDSGVGQGPDGKDLPGKDGYVEFLPWDSEAGRALDRKQNVENVRKGFRQRSRAELRADAEKEDPVESVVERLVALCVGWHLVNPDRTVLDVPFSKENARELFSAPALAWLRRQCFVFVNNEANFMKSSSKNSTSSQITNSD